MAMLPQSAATTLKTNNGYDIVPTKDDVESGPDKKQKGKKSILHHFKPLIFLFFLILYSFIGGFIFHLVERDNPLHLFELDHIKNEKLKDQTILYIYNLLDFEEFAMANSNETNFNCSLNGTSALANLNITSLLPYNQLKEILNVFSENYTHKDARDVGDWSFMGSVFYAGTVYTTIGYGNIIPHTVSGRLITIFYAILGIPMMLFTLAQIGKMFCSGLLHLYLYVRFFFCRCGRDPKKKVDMVGDFPLSLAIIVTFGWMCMCSGLFCAWEKDWDFFISFYFFFQSLTTIGLGKLVFITCT